jgi:hypothetical protein
LSLYFSAQIGEIFKIDLNLSTSKEMVSTLFTTAGQALLGASFIVFSFIMFSMQVNIERLPHGLFRSLSTDKKLLGYFLSTIALSTCMLALPLFNEVTSIPQGVIAGVWIIVLTIFLYIQSYKRALLLVNPIEQINYMLSLTDKSLKFWNRQANVHQANVHSAMLKRFGTEAPEVHGKQDLQRFAFFQKNPLWYWDTKTAVDYAVSISRTYASRGDQQVSSQALSAVVILHQKYITVRGKTFFRYNPFYPTSLSDEPFLSDTLEKLRKNLASALSSKNEEYITQHFRCFTELTRAYSMADYGDGCDNKHAPELAASYLSGAVKETIPCNLRDVLMEGARQMGNATRSLVNCTTLDTKFPIIDELRLLAITGVASSDYQPITLTVISQLAALQYDLILYAKNDKDYAIEQIRTGVFSFAELFLEIQDTQLMSSHKMYLAPYFSPTDTNSFPTKMEKLAIAISEQNTENNSTECIIRNICEYSDQVYADAKKLLLKSIEKKSAFTFDIVHWISNVSKSLNMLANSLAGEDYSEYLLKSSRFLFGTFTFIPKDKDSVCHTCNWSILNAMTETAFHATEEFCPSEAEFFVKVLSEWTFEIATIDKNRSMTGLVTLVAIGAKQNGRYLQSTSSLITTSIEKLKFSEDEKNDICQKLTSRIERAQSRQTAFDKSDYVISKLSVDDVNNALQAIQEKILT